jgi:hypothetical protein
MINILKIDTTVDIFFIKHTVVPVRKDHLSYKTTSFCLQAYFPMVLMNLRYKTTFGWEKERS